MVGVIISTAEEVGLSTVRLRAIDRWMQAYIDQGKLPGAITVIARHGRVAYSESYGYRDIDSRQPLGDDAIFRIYSMTKPITTVAAMMLYEQGGFQLDDPVSRYIPAFEDARVFVEGDIRAYDTRPALAEMTIHHLMTHMSGLTYGFLEQSTVDYIYKHHGVDFNNSALTLGEMVNTVAMLPLLSDPGEAWNYSVSTDVLGYLVEVISGQTLERFIREHITRPLGMADTAFSVPPEKTARLTSCYDYTDKNPLKLFDHAQDSHWAKPITLFSGGGGLVSTAADYLRFAQMLLNGGELDGARILGRKTIEFMRMNHLQGDLADNGQPVFSETSYEGIGFGLGFSVMLDPAKAKFVGSVGEYAWGGLASTAFWIDPVEDMIVIFLTQLRPSSTYPLRRELHALAYQALID